MTKTITLAVTGSISAYKSADLTNQLTKLGYDVHVLMTKAATDFITPLTLQVLSKNPVHLDVMKEKDSKIINHIELAKQADLFILARQTNWGWNFTWLSLFTGPRSGFQPPRPRGDMGEGYQPYQRFSCDRHRLGCSWSGLPDLFQLIPLS